MGKLKNFKSIFIPSITVFISSFCIMVLELVASRLIARHLGASLYTWTAVIGVILAGITIGNYLGGRIADKFPAKKTVAVLFAVCSAACVVTIILNNLAGNWALLWQLNWPLRVFSHVALVFLLPSALLGMISPVVAKMALDRGLATGRTIGTIYSWGAAGSIAGTFAAGYYLIAAIGTVTIIWIVGAVLLTMSILYWAKSRALYIWAIIFAALMTMAMIPAKWAKDAGSSIALRERPDSDILYEDESRYCYITVRQGTDNVNRRFFYQDKLVHSEILMNDISDLQYFYAKIYAAVTEGLSKNKEKLSVMVIGGGGYVYPRYIEKVWPGSRIDVAEIDPDVTKAAKSAFGLQENTTINTINMDARNYVDTLLEQKRNGGKIPQYDFVYGDAFNDYSVPFQLITQEFNEKLFAILSDDGAYMLNMVDTLDSGLFLGSVVNTLEKTFPFVYVTANDDDTSSSARRTFVVIAAKHELDLKNIISQYKREKLKLLYLDSSAIGKLKEQSKHLVLTDNYSPTENLLAPVIRSSARDVSAENYVRRAEELKEKERFAESIENFRLAANANPVLSTQVYNEIGIIYGAMGNLEQSAEAFNQAIEYNNNAKHKVSVASIHFSLGLTLKAQGKLEQAMKQIRKASAEFQKEVIERPAHQESWRRLGYTLAITGNYKAAADAFKQAIELNPADPACYDNLVKAFEYDGQYSQAIEVLKKYIQLMKQYKEDETVSQLQKHLESLENKNSKNKPRN